MKGKIVIAGGTGFLGQSIVGELKQHTGVEIVVLSRSSREAHDGVRYQLWDAKSPGPWQEELEGADAVINLVGRSVNCRYTRANKEQIVSSRVNASRAIGEAIAKSMLPPRVWINLASAAIYGNGRDQWKSEDSTPGEGFSVEVCQLWEKAFFEAQLPRTRRVALRAGLVFQRNRGLLLPFVNLANRGLGGTIGSGAQYISWIHERDFLNLIIAIIEDDSYEGVYNCCSPGPVNNRDFMMALRKQLRVPFGLPTPSFLVRIGAFFVPTEAELVLTGRRVVSNRLKERSFSFQFPDIEEAVRDLLS